MSDGFDVRGRALQAGELAAWLAEHSLGNRFGLAVASEGDAEALAIVAADGDGRHIDPAALTADDEAALASWLADPGPPKAVHDAKAATRALAGRGWTLRGVTSDPALAAWLVLPDQPSLALNDLLRRYLRRELPADSTLILAACAVLDLADVLDQELARVEASSLLARVELPVQRVLAGMEAVGVAVDREQRIHPSFHQTTATGRISSSRPNLHTTPRLREALVAGDGYAELMTARYDELEMRILAHLSGDAGLIDAFDEEDPYRALASRIFSTPIGDVTPQLRQGVATLSYGLTRGLSDDALAALLRLTPFEAAEQKRWYLGQFGGVRDHLQSVHDDVRRGGFVSTIVGRRLYLSEDGSAPRTAVEAAIQGSAADIIKIALINVDEAIAGAALKSRLVLQADDELVFEVAAGERDVLAAHMCQCMCAAYELAAPLEVSIA